MPMVSTSQLEHLRLRAEAETGMDLAGTRFPRLQAALERVLAQRPGADLERILAHADELAAFVENLTAELTVGESFFMRNEHHFRALREQVFPQILRDNASQREVRVWSAGCATGEEPYSLAILLDQLLAGQGHWQVSILGTDLNLAFLERARQARYRQWSFRQTDVHQDRRYFSADGEWFVLAPRLCSPVRFAYLNLVKDVYPSAMTGTLGLDLILFRNVAIYLRPEVTTAIIERFQRALRPGGWLLLGEVELSLTQTAGLERRQFEQATFFQKPTGLPGGAPPLASSLAPPGVAAQSLGGTSIPGVPVLPHWAPLPWTTAVRRSAPARSADLALFEQVERHARLKEFTEAERVLESIASTKERAQRRLRYIRLLLETAEVARVRHLLDVCLREEPLTIEGQLLKAGFAEEVGDLDSAEQAYRRALYIDRQCVLAHFHLGLVLQQKGDQAGTRRSLQTTLELIRDKNPQALVEYGEGICYGRLLEMATLLMHSSSTSGQE
jgi:chemotaxis protein methyltransferase CheR